MPDYSEYSYFDKGEISAWMPMIGFDKTEPDRGVAKLLSRMQFKPHDMSAFVFHPDFVHHHEGLEKEVHLHPDNCSYYASPRNEERCRQDWTNWELKELLDNLNAAGVNVFLGIMGVTLDNKYHKEWVSDHPELMSRSSSGSSWGLHVLKRFKDGTYYEDFFVEKLCKALTDYNFYGLHVTDCFCPGNGVLETHDYSLDMVDQFVTHTGLVLPARIAALRDTDADLAVRAQWIWENARQEWITFHAWRWEQFWKKVCARVHAIGKKVFVLGMYCTDPFETLYVKGIDLRKIVEAGVDYLMPNQAACGATIQNEGRKWRYYEHATMMPLSDAFAPNARKLNMLGVKDGTEEWDMLHHAPTLLERDIYYLLSYHRYTKNGLKRCLDGYNVCLSDGIYADEWKWLRERFDVAFCETPEKILLPTVVWSDAAFDNILPEFIRHRRWTTQRFMVGLARTNTQTGAMVRSEDITDKCGDLFVPNFDLLSEDEKKQIAAYTGGAVICTASAEKELNLADYGITPVIDFKDQHSPYVNRAFAWNLEIADPAAVLAQLEEDDDTPILEDPFRVTTPFYPNLRDEMPYQKVSVGFLKALGMLVKANLSKLVESTRPILPMQMADGRIRVYSINENRNHYGVNFITFHQDIKEVKNVSKFPMLPVKFSNNGVYSVMTNVNPEGLRTFRLPTPQGGIAIVDVYLK